MSCYDDVSALIKSKARNGHDAEDIIQDSYVRAVEKRGLYDSGREIKPWMMTLSMNRARSFYNRGDLRFVFPVEGSLIADSRDGPVDLVFRDDEIERVRHLISEMGNERYRAAMQLRYVEDYDNSEIAVILGEPEGKIRRWLYEGRNLFRAAWKKSEKA